MPTKNRCNDCTGFRKQLAQCKRNTRALQDLVLECQERCKNLMDEIPTNGIINLLESRLPTTAAPYLELLRTIYFREVLDESTEESTTLNKKLH